jgi:hypothetical protein
LNLRYPSLKFQRAFSFGRPRRREEASISCSGTKTHEPTLFPITEKSMMPLSKRSISAAQQQQSHVNAAWDDQQREGRFRRPSLVSAKEFLFNGKKTPPHRKKKEKRRSRSVPSSSCSSRLSPAQVKKTLLVKNDEKMKHLLRMLRSNDFAGTIDLEHHSQYLQAPSTSKVTKALQESRQHHSIFSRSQSEQADATATETSCPIPATICITRDVMDSCR